MFGNNGFPVQQNMNNNNGFPMQQNMMNQSDDNGFPNQQNLFNNMNMMNNMNMNNMNMNNMNMMNNMNNMNMMNMNMNMNNMMNNMNNMNMMNMNMNNMNMMNPNMMNTNMMNMNMMNNINYNNMLLNQYNKNIMMMKYKMMQNAHQINLMNNEMKKKKMEIIMNQILDGTYQKNDDNNDYPESDNFQEDEDNNDPQPNEALSDAAREELVQRQNFENYQPPSNITFEEVDPLFMNSFISNKELFDGKGHNLIGKWAHGENRGGKPYTPPDGWIGFGLNVIGKYDNGNNDWLACNGRPGEWCIAYHGACNGVSNSDQVKNIIKDILEHNLRPGSGQAYKTYNDDNHPGQKVGVGVYCSPNPTVIDGYAGRMEVNGHYYRVAFMLRVKPDKIRFSNSKKDYWVLNGGNGDFSEIRPYRFLIKKAS